MDKSGSVNKCKCGRTPELYCRQYGYRDSDTDWRVICKCGAKTAFYYTEQEAINDWNTGILLVNSKLEAGKEPR